MPMRWGKHLGVLRRLAPVATVVALGLGTAGCFQPLYGNHTLAAGDSVRDRMAGVEVVPIVARNGTPEARLAVALRNALMYDLNGGAASAAPTYRLQITINSAVTTVIIDVVSGRPATQIEVLNAAFTLTEIASQKVVLSTTTFARASFDAPGGGLQRFARQRAGRDAEDRAVATIAENIRNRLASYFVAGT
jgi:LPS-assembly lipoprotein